MALEKSHPPTAALVFGSDVCVGRMPDGTIQVSDALADLLVDARSSYAWPSTESPLRSQQRILDLESEVAERIQKLDPEKGHWIVQEVSRWGGNNVRSQRVIERALPTQKEVYVALIKQTSESIRHALEGLCQLPGVHLVMATKIYRFCSPNLGAAIDRHCSYFFNSLPLMEGGQQIRTATQFKREWSTGKHQSSRLADYSASGHRANLQEYVTNYLPLLKAIADHMNHRGNPYRCAASSQDKKWRPADVEMAAYYWWSRKANSR